MPKPMALELPWLAGKVSKLLFAVCLQTALVCASLCAQSLDSSLRPAPLPFADSSPPAYRAIEDQVSKYTEDSAAIELDGAILKTIDATTLAAQVAGPVREILVKEGDIVKSGQSLGRIVDDSLRLELEQLKTQISVAQKKQANNIDERLAEKSLQVATTEYQRALKANARVPDTYPINEIDRLKLVADHAQLELERAKYEQELAAFEVTLAQGNYRQTYERYTRHQLLSPAAGVVVAVEKRAGEWVEPGTDLLRIVRIDQLRVEGFIASTLAVPQIVGRAAHIRLMETTGNVRVQSRVWQGKVIFVSPDANPVNGQVRVFIEVENMDGLLRPGLRVAARIEANPETATGLHNDPAQSNVRLPAEKAPNASTSSKQPELRTDQP